MSILHNMWQLQVGRLCRSGVMRSRHHYFGYISTGTISIPTIVLGFAMGIFRIVRIPSVVAEFARLETLYVVLDRRISSMSGNDHE